jgi:hypothetical protein
MSDMLLVSPGTRLEALELKATKRPLRLVDGSELELFPWLPALSTLTRSVTPAPYALAAGRTTIVARSAAIRHGRIRLTSFPVAIGKSAYSNGP